MGAALTAVTPRVLEMLDRRAKQKTDITEQELAGDRQGDVRGAAGRGVHLQRSTPYDVETTRPANLAFIDYFERLKNQGGHMSFLPGEERKLEAEGWRAQRIADLRSIIAMREERGVSLIRPDEIDRHLAAAGFAVDDRLRWMLELALYPATATSMPPQRRNFEVRPRPGRWRLAIRPCLHTAQPSPSPVAGVLLHPSVGLRRCQRLAALHPGRGSRADDRHDAPLLEHRKGGKAGEG